MDFARLFLLKEALASSQLEGIGLDLTFRDLVIADFERQEKARRAARRAEKKAAKGNPDVRT